MSREIKFRIWNVTGNCMHEWRELVEKNKIHLLANQQYAYPVMQYTGLKDKNGVEIYEGDIVEQYHFTDKSGKAVTILHTVVWSGKYNGWACLNCKSNDESDGSPQLWVYSKTPFAVVGNIYQKQDLLK